MGFFIFVVCLYVFCFLSSVLYFSVTFCYVATEVRSDFVVAMNAVCNLCVMRVE